MDDIAAGGKKKRVLAIDLGEARTGVAVSDLTLFLASPIKTIFERDFGRLADEIVDICDHYDVGKIVLGYPKNMDGTLGKSAVRSEEFVELLKGKSDYEIILWDERMSTNAAENYLNANNVRGKKRKNIIDTVAATLILQSYLDSL